MIVKILHNIPADYDPAQYCRIFENVADIDFHAGSSDTKRGIYLNIHNAEEVKHIELENTTVYVMTDTGKTIDRFDI